MISSTVKFLLNNKILEIDSPDPNQTILNYIRTDLKKTGTKEYFYNFALAKLFPILSCSICVYFVSPIPTSSAVG